MFVNREIGTLRLLLNVLPSKSILGLLCGPPLDSLSIRISKMCPLLERN